MRICSTVSFFTTHTEPAKPMPTSFASYMHTASVFLYRDLTFGTSFCILCYPCSWLGLFIFLINLAIGYLLGLVSIRANIPYSFMPFMKHITLNWVMGFSQTSKAIRMSTGTFYFLSFTKFCLTNDFTVSWRTPLEEFVWLDKRLCYEFLIPRILFISQYRRKDWWCYNIFALRVWTYRQNYIRSCR